MKKALLISIFVISSIHLHSQDYLGLNTGNYSGVTGVSLQPANVADNRYQFDINLISASVNFDNNFLGFSRNYFLNNRFSFKDFNSYEDFKKRVLVENQVKGNNVYFNLNNRIQAPLSFLLTTGPKSGIALNIQSRTSVAMRNLNPAFAKQVYEFWKYTPSQGQFYDVSGMELNALNWLEVGLTYGRVLMNQEKHFLKFGVTAKYLGGISSWNLKANDLKIKADKDSFMTAYGTDIKYSRSNSNISTNINSSYRPDASSWGGDIGFVYEFRGRIDKFKFKKYDKEEDYVESKLRRDKNKYSAKLGVSLLDVGVLKFKSAPLARNFNINTTNFNMWALDIRNIQEFDTLISKNVNYTGAASQEYSVAMPTALSAQLDLHLLKGFYVNAMAYMPFNMLNKNTDFRIPTAQYYAVTPRWESRVAGVYVPFSMNSNNVISAGATVRVGPIFVGTSNLLTMIKKDNIQNADVHAGLKIPLAFGKPSKAANWFKKITNESETTIENNTINLKESPKPQTAPQPIQITINNYNAPNNGTNNGSNSKSFKINGNNGEQEIMIEENSIDVKELNDLQNQIEYLQNKLNQKEELINEIEKGNKSGSDNTESKKKIDSLKYVYFYDTSFVSKNRIVKNTLTLEEQKEKTNLLLKELANLQQKDVEITKRIENYTNSIDNQFEVSKNNHDDKKTSELFAKKEQINQIKTNTPIYYVWQNGVKTPVNTISENNSIEKKQYIDKNNLSTISSPFPSYEKRQTKIVAQETSIENKPIQTQDLSKLVTKKDAENLMTKNDYESLKNEIAQLKQEVKNSRNANMATTAVSNGGGLFRRRKDKTKVIIDTTFIGRNIQLPTQEVKIVRDTIYIDRPVESIVKLIVRDTVTNTIEKNNTITKVEEKTVFKNNERELILAASPDVILFDIGSFMIKSIYFNKLVSLANKLKKYPDLKIDISGHADNTGNAERNKQLSEDRADAVRVYLIKQGVKRENIFVDALVDKDPFADNKSKVGKSQNRRVVLKIGE